MKRPTIQATRASRFPIATRKRMALGYLQEAWAEARHDGIDGDCLAQACLFTALAEFVTTYGEEAAANFTDGLSGPDPQRRVLRSSSGNNLELQLDRVSRNRTLSPWAGVASSPSHITFASANDRTTGQPVTLTPS